MSEVQKNVDVGECLGGYASTMPKVQNERAAAQIESPRKSRWIGQDRSEKGTPTRSV